MKRTLVTNQELAKWLTAELRKIEDCGECTISGVTPLEEPDINGCNWSTATIIVHSCDVEVSYSYLQH